MSTEKEQSRDSPGSGAPNSTESAHAPPTAASIQGEEGNPTARLWEGRDDPRPTSQNQPATAAEKSPQNSGDHTNPSRADGNNTVAGNIQQRSNKDLQTPPIKSNTETSQAATKIPKKQEVQPPLSTLAPESASGSSTYTPATSVRRETPAATLPQGALAGTIQTVKPPIASEATAKLGAVAKGGGAPPIVIQDNSCINALLSLGRDLRGGVTDGRQQVVPILPMMPSNDHRKKRQKVTGAMSMPGNEKSLLPDFWYWLPPDETVGEWDVLCGRGGESNNYIGNKKYRKIVNERKEAYRTIPLKQRKAKTAFVKSIVQHVNNCGGRFVDLDEASGRYYVVTMEKARKKTSQALRETKELKWLETEPKEKKAPANKDSVCPFCSRPGHKTKIAKACKLHHEWLDANPGKAGIDNGEKGQEDEGGGGGKDTNDVSVKSEQNQPNGSGKQETRDDKASQINSTGSSESSEPAATQVSEKTETCNGDLKKQGATIASESSAAYVTVQSPNLGHHRGPAQNASW